MRLAFPAAAAALVISLSPAFAQTAAAPAAPPPAMTAPAAPAPTMAPTMTPAAPATSTAAPKTAHKRQTLQERFDAANTTHDGHLTQAQAASAKWTYVNKHFSAIDKDHKGYVTVDDIHAYAHAVHTAKHTNPAAKPAAPATTTN